MKQTVIFLLFVFFTQNGFCEKKLLVDKALEYQTSMEMDNLSGNVTQMQHFQQKIINGKIDSLRPYRKTQYNENKKLIYEEQYFTYGAKEFDYSYRFFYDDFNRQIKRLWYSPAYKTAYFETNYKYLDDKNRIEQYSIEDYTGKSRDKKPVVYNRITLINLDSFQNSVIEKSIYNNDTTITTRKYIYNNFGKYTAVLSISKRKSGIDKCSEVDDYDSNQNIIKQEFFSNDKIDYARYLKYNGTSEYDVESLTELNNDSLFTVTKFEKKFLPIEKQTLKREKLLTSEIYQYKFDSQNNWIEKKVLSQDFSKGEKEAKLTSIETREIKYYK
jgi:hypothetical protein